MTLDEIRETIAMSSEKDWNRFGIPTYRDNVLPLGDAEQVETHDSGASYTDDVKLTIAWGMSPSGHDGPLEGAWKTIWPLEIDSLYMFLLDIFYSGSLIDRHVGCRVAGRAVLPFPNFDPIAPAEEYTGTGALPPVGWKTTQLEVDLFRLIHEFMYPENYQAFIEESQIIVEPSD